MPVFFAAHPRALALHMKVHGAIRRPARKWAEMSGGQLAAVNQRSDALDRALCDGAFTGGLAQGRKQGDLDPLAAVALQRCARLGG